FILSHTFRKNGVSASDNDPWGMIQNAADRDKWDPQAHTPRPPWRANPHTQTSSREREEGIMRRLMLREWLGSSVCAAVLMAGCNQAQRQPAYSTRPMGSVAMLPGYTPGTVFTTTAAAASSSLPKSEPVAALPAPAASDSSNTPANKPTEA